MGGRGECPSQQHLRQPGLLGDEGWLEASPREGAVEPEPTTDHQSDRKWEENKKTPRPPSVVRASAVSMAEADVGLAQEGRQVAWEDTQRMLGQVWKPCTPGTPGASVSPSV